MQKSGVLSVVTAGLLLFMAGLGASAADSEPTRPPTNLKLVGDHWTPWDPPPAGPGAYIIVKGDTLWDLAEEWLGDPFLWPQIWDENRYILDSHWIYPGDPLVIPGRPTVVPDEGLPPVDEGTGEPDGGAGDVEPVEPTALEPEPLVPIAHAVDLHCSGYIEPDHAYSDLWVAGHELERKQLGEGDVIYLSQGRNQGIQSGDEFAVIRSTHPVEHPETGQVLGDFIRRLGKARVLTVQDNTSIAVLQLSCEDIRDSDELVPWQEIPIPRRRSMPEFDRYDVSESGGPIGHVVRLVDDRATAGAGHVIHTDLGVASGVQPGDALTLFRDNGELPRTMIGQAVVLTVEPLTSTVKLTLTVRETEVGDRIEVIQ